MSLTIQPIPTQRKTYVVKQKHDVLGYVVKSDNGWTATPAHTWMHDVECKTRGQAIELLIRMVDQARELWSA